MARLSNNFYSISSLSNLKDTLLDVDDNPAFTNSSYLSSSSTSYNNVPDTSSPTPTSPGDSSNVTSSHILPPSTPSSTTSSVNSVASNISSNSAGSSPILLTVICNTVYRSEEHTSELQSRFDLVCRLLLEKKNLIY